MRSALDGVQNQAKDRIWVRASPPAQVRVWSQVLGPCSERGQGPGSGPG